MEFNTPELLPCPWCQSIPKLSHTEMTHSSNKAVRITCSNRTCLVKPSILFNSSFQTCEEIEPHAVKAWNARQEKK